MRTNSVSIIRQYTAANDMSKQRNEKCYLTSKSSKEKKEKIEVTYIFDHV